MLRLGEVLPSAEQPRPNTRALTHLLLSAIHRLGVAPDVPIRSDYTPVDYASARILAAVFDQSAWGRTVHVFHPDSVDFAAALTTAGAPVARVGGTDFLTRLAEAAARTGDRDLAGLAALLPAPGASHARQELAGLLTDNPALYRRDECQRLEERGRLPGEDISDAIAAYRGYLDATAAGATV